MSSYLFKLAGQQQISKLKESSRTSDIVTTSVALQVLSSETSFIGVVKQSTKATGDLEQVEMPVICSIANPKPEERRYDYD